MKIISFEESMFNLINIEKKDVYIKTKDEKITKGYFGYHNYNLHFFFCVNNNSDKEEKVNFYINTKKGDNLKKNFKWLWVSNEKLKNYEKIFIKGKMNGKGKYKFKLRIPEKKELYIANYIPKDFKSIINNIKNISKNKGANINIFGKSIEKRPLYSIEFGNPYKKPTLIFLTGYHPPEMDIIISEEIIKKIKKSYINKIIDNFSVVIIPFINPDGYYNYLQGSNKNEINFHWKFFGNTKENCPESFYLWEYCKRIKPIFYMDFHMFTFQDKNKKSYNIPTIYLKTNKAKKIQNEINLMLNNICNKNDKIIEKFFISKKILSPIILATKLREKYGTVTSPKFHFHLRYGEETCRNEGIIIFNNILKIFEDNMPLKENDLKEKNKIHEYYNNYKYYILKYINFNLRK